MSDAEAEVSRALEAYLNAFEQGDIAAMRSAYAEDALSFPRIHAGQSPVEDGRGYRRVRGMDPEMRRVIEAHRSAGQSPPYLSIEPQDLDVRVIGRVALATFHIVSSEHLGRRTLVFELRDGQWMILHQHASNVTLAGR